MVQLVIMMVLIMVLLMVMMMMITIVISTHHHKQLTVCTENLLRFIFINHCVICLRFTLCHLWWSSVWVLVCWWWWFGWSFPRLIAPVVTTTSIILSSDKIQNEDILVPAHPDCPGKWPLNKRRRRLLWWSINFYGLILAPLIYVVQYNAHLAK